jgi:predicted SAM-dependent methyltransferase
MVEEQIMKLHLGCFDQILEGWINTDITPHLWVSRIPFASWSLFKVGLMTKERYGLHRSGIFRRVRYLNVKKRFSFAENSVDYVYSSHLIDNLDPPDALFCLKEIHRVLKKGGIVRTTVPDLDKMIGNYDPERPEFFLHKLFEAGERWNKNRQHWHYNEFSMIRLLREAGFEDIRRCAYRQGRCPGVAAIENRPDSLFMEAVK